MGLLVPLPPSLPLSPSICSHLLPSSLPLFFPPSCLLSLFPPFFLLSSLPSLPPSFPLPSTLLLPSLSVFSLSASSPPLQLCRTHHYTSRDMFWEHVNLIVNNCITYNGNILVALHSGCGLSGHVTCNADGGCGLSGHVTRSCT